MLLTLLSLLFSPVPSRAANLGCECGVRAEKALDVRVYGGEEAVPNEFPWVVLVLVRNISSSDFITCGGTLISDRHVLTAAHCIEPGKIWAILGEHNTAIRDDTELILEADNFLVHPKYKRKNYNYDYALLRLKKIIDFSAHPHIRPACLPDSNFINFPDNTTVLGYGWGAGVRAPTFRVFRDSCDATKNNSGCFNYGDDSESGTSDTLQKIDLSIIEHQACAEFYRNFSNAVGRKTNPVYIYGFNVCAARLDRPGDICSGDSGGSLVHQTETGKYQIVGIVSYGFGCGSTFEGMVLPGIYGRVSSIVDWIFRVTKDGGFCAQ